MAENHRSGICFFFWVVQFQILDLVLSLVYRLSLSVRKPSDLDVFPSADSGGGVEDRARQCDSEPYRYDTAYGQCQLPDRHGAETRMLQFQSPREHQRCCVHVILTGLVVPASCTGHRATLGHLNVT